MLRLIVLLLTAGVASGGMPAGLVAELQKKWPGNRTVNIVVHGHSVPAGYHRTPEVRPFESYPHLLRCLLSRAYPTAVINVITTAIGGENSVAGAARFERDVLPHRPDLVLIDYALNDRRVSPEAMETAWRSMVEAARKAGVPVVLVTPTGDANEDLGDGTGALAIRAALIRRLAAEEKVILADVSAAWVKAVNGGVPQQDLLSQVNHPNLKGHELAAEAIFAALQP